MEYESDILEYAFDRMQDAMTADECRKIVQRAIVLTKEHKFERLRQEFGVL